MSLPLANEAARIWRLTSELAVSSPAIAPASACLKLGQHRSLLDEAARESVGRHIRPAVSTRGRSARDSPPVVEEVLRHQSGDRVFRGSSGLDKMPPIMDDCREDGKLVRERQFELGRSQNLGGQAAHQSGRSLGRRRRLDDQLVERAQRGGELDPPLLDAPPLICTAGLHAEHVREVLEPCVRVRGGGLKEDGERGALEQARDLEREHRRVGGRRPEALHNSPLKKASYDPRRGRQRKAGRPRSRRPQTEREQRVREQRQLPVHLERVKREVREEEQVWRSGHSRDCCHSRASSTTASASPRGHRWDGGRVKVLTKKNVRVRDPPDTRVGHHQVGEPLVQHADLLHGGGEEVCSIQSGQEPRPECSVEKHIENVIPIEEGACLLVPAELAPRQEGALGVALPQGVAGHCCCTVVHGSPIQERRVVPYVLSTWSENEHCVAVDLNLVNDDGDGSQRSWRSLLLRHLHLSSPLLPPHRKLRPPATERLAGGRGEEHKGTSGRPSTGMRILEI